MGEHIGVGALSRESIRKLIQGPDALIADYLDLEHQLQPNGFDVTLRSVSRFSSAGELNETTTSLAAIEDLAWDASGRLHLTHGPYLAVINERIDLPLNIMALMRPRSSLLRSGVALHTAVWDAGYRGRSQVMLTVYNPHGFCLSQNSRVGQLIFLGLDQVVLQGYEGFYQDENLAPLGIEAEDPRLIRSQGVLF